MERMLIEVRKIRRVLLVTLVLLIVLTTVNALAAETVVKMYNEAAAGDESRFKNTDEGTVAVQLNVKGGKFVGLEIPSWYNAPSSTALILFKWDTDYNTTIKKDPIFTDVIEDMESSGWIDPGQNDFTVKFDRAFAEGKYLLVYRKHARYPLHIPTHSAFEDSVAYFEGKVYENVSYRISCIVDPDAELNEAPNIKVELDINEVIVPIYGTGASSDGLSYITVSTYESVAQKFTVANGKLTGFVINDLFVESGYAEIELYVYKWKDNYDETVKTTPIYANKFNAETGGAGSYEDFVMKFERAYAEGDYLVKIVSTDSVNLWAHALKGGVTGFIDGEEYLDGTLKLSYLVNSSAELDERPFEMPTPEPTQEPTPTPEATQTPTATPNVTEEPKVDEGTNNVVFIILAIAAVVTIGAAVLIFINLKKR